VGEIVADGASKARAAIALAQSVGLGPPAIIAFGDNFNDLELLRLAGSAGCPPDALPCILEIASFQIASCAEEGVATYLEHLLGDDGGVYALNLSKSR